MPRVAEIDAELHATLVERGENSVQADYAARQVYGENKRPLVHMWLLEQAEARQVAAEAREERMIAATEKSASATKWATIAAAVSAFAAAATYYMTFLHKP